MLVEKEMATHSNILAWRIPRTEEADGLQSTGLPRAGHDWVTKYACIPCYMTINAMMRWKRTIRKAQGGKWNFKFKYPGLCWSNWEGIFEQGFEKFKDNH